MNTETVIIERYVVRQAMHIGALRRNLNLDDVIEWQPETEMLKINGNRIDAAKDVSPGEAMRQLRVLSERNPDNPPLKELAPIEEGEKQELKTSTLCVLPILGCLVAAEKYLEKDKGLPSEISPITDEQKDFLEMFEDLMDYVPSIKELESISDTDASVINAWLKSKGFEIELPEENDGFAMASVLDVLLEWLNEGKRTSITDQTGQEHVGVNLKKGVTVSHSLAVHQHPVVRIACKNGDTVCMSMVDEVPEGFSGLFLKVADLEKVKTYSNFEGTQFPMIDLDDRPDISFIQGLELGQGFFVGTALQQTKFRMNEQGARAQSAAAMDGIRSAMAPRLPHVIDRPFLLWVKREGFGFPIFAGLMCEDVWKEPTEL